jgi:transposase
MGGRRLMGMTDAQWAGLAPLVEACRPRSKRPQRDLRRPLDGIIWRHRDGGATWRALPAEHGPWWRSAQLFIRWSRLGAWQRLLELAQARGVELGLALLDGSSIRAHHKAAGARERGPRAGSATGARRSAARAAASARRPASSPTGAAGRPPSP